MRDVDFGRRSADYAEHRPGFPDSFSRAPHAPRVAPGAPPSPSPKPARTTPSSASIPASDTLKDSTPTTTTPPPGAEHAACSAYCSGEFEILAKKADGLQRIVEGCAARDVGGVQLPEFFGRIADGVESAPPADGNGAAAGRGAPASEAG